MAYLCGNFSLYIRCSRIIKNTNSPVVNKVLKAELPKPMGEIMSVQVRVMICHAFEQSSIRKKNPSQADQHEYNNLI